jgi:hypothetical protein
MKSKMGMWLVTMFFLAGAVGLMQAQDTTMQDNTAKGDTHMNVRTLTGCLQKGEDANEYNLIAQDGGTWEVKSDSVNLGSHVGHTVTITGAVAHPMTHGMKEDAKSEAKEHGMGKASTEHGHLTATDVTMVSDTCKP